MRILGFSPETSRNAEISEVFLVLDMENDNSHHGPPSMLTFLLLSSAGICSFLPEQESVR